MTIVAFQSGQYLRRQTVVQKVFLGPQVYVFINGNDINKLKKTAIDDSEATPLCWFFCKNWSNKEGVGHCQWLLITSLFQNRIAFYWIQLFVWPILQSDRVKYDLNLSLDSLSVLCSKIAKLSIHFSL